MRGRAKRRRTPDNPFATAPGRAPAVLAGRDALLAAFHRALTEGPNHRNFFCYLVGARGYGKTVMLQEIGAQASNARWTVLPFDGATDQLYERFAERVLETVVDAASSSSRIRRLLPTVSVNFPASATLDWGPNRTGSTGTEGLQLSVRKCLELLADEAVGREAGLLVSIDELHDASAEDLRRIGNDIQLVQGQNPDRWISFVGAGLPDLVEPDGLLEHVSTFLHRGRRISVEPLTNDEAAASLAGGYLQAHLNFDEDVLAEGVAAARGHPWYLQLVGHHTVEAALLSHTKRISPDVASAGIAAAHQEAGPMLLTPVWNRLSHNDRNLVAAIAAQGGTCSVAAVREQLGWSSQMVNQYRIRLEHRGWVHRTRRGELALTHPQTLPWLQQELGPHADGTTTAGDLADTSDQPHPDGLPDAHAHLSLVNSLPNERPPTRCGVQGPRSKAPCVLPAGHQGQHRYH